MNCSFITYIREHPTLKNLLSTMTDVGAQRRLKEALEKISSGQLDECPVCLECPSATDARILRCCAAVMCRHCIPSCKKTCPFCRAPFQEGRLERAGEGESPYTYTTQDYSQHTEFTITKDYVVSRTGYTTKDYSAGSSYANSSKDYCVTSAPYATKDYSVRTSAYTTKNYSVSSTAYTTKDYSASTSYSSKDYSVDSSKYSVPADKYKAI
jgi:hypothetical protein